MASWVERGESRHRIVPSRPAAAARTPTKVGSMTDDRSREWQARKATHAADPFADLIKRVAVPAAVGMGSATAIVNGVVVASSQRVQRANQRVYFPLADCTVASFTPSDKRWR